MRFISLFSGIEAASEAWAPLGWEPVAYAEIEPFPCDVLSVRHPGVTNLGDVTKVTREDVKRLGHADVVIGGFPCQDLSVAGKRQGLKNDDGTSTRSGLFFDGLRIADWSEARFTVIENVMGLFSSNDGQDFAAVVGALAGLELDVPRDGWKNAGVVLGPRGLVEWCVLDAQYHGLAQRRQRVFIVRDSGNWRDRPPLFLEPYRLQGHPAPSREAGERTSPTIAGCSNGGGANGPCRTADDAESLIPIISGALSRGDAKGQNSGLDQGAPLIPVVSFDCKAGGDTNFAVDEHVAGSLIKNHGGGRSAIAFSCKDHGADAGEISPTLLAMSADKSHANAGGQVAIAHTLRSTGHDASEDGTGRGTPLVPAAYGVRRLTPRECERLQGFPDDFTLIPRGKKGKMAADAPRYAALGNSMAVPCIRWIGERIEMAIRSSK